MRHRRAVAASLERDFDAVRCRILKNIEALIADGGDITLGHIDGVACAATAAGAMLVEAGPTGAKRVAQALPGRQYTLERKTARVPERRPLERAKLAARAP